LSAAREVEFQKGDVPMGLDFQPGKRQYVKFSFFKALPEWRRLDPLERDRQQSEFRSVIDAWSEPTMVRCYSTVGTRADVDFMIWQVSYQLSDLHDMASELLGTDLAGWLEMPHSYLSMTKHSQYVEKHSGPGREKETRLTLAPGEKRYLFVYPLTKLRPWYTLGKEDRQEAMNQHIAIGHTYPTVKINTTYSFGLDDQEFVLAFETDEPGDFLDLVQDLRASMSSAYTEKDVPIFTCISMSAAEMLESVAGKRAVARIG
jgi:chlorite dismutase